MKLFEISVEVGDRKILAKGFGQTGEGRWLTEALADLSEKVIDALFDLHESNEHGKSWEGVLCVLTRADDPGDFEWWLKEKRYSRHRNALEKAFLAAYPAGGEHRRSYIPFHDWEDEAWDAFRRKAELGLISNGKDDPTWIEYCQKVSAHKYFCFVKEQRDDWYQKRIDFGLPLLPIAQMKKMFEEKRWEAFEI